MEAFLAILTWIIGGIIIRQFHSLVFNKNFDFDRGSIACSIILGPLMIAPFIVSLIDGDYI